jgi:hypothetical protein
LQLVLGLFAGGASLAPALKTSTQDWLEVEKRLEDGAAGVLVFERPVDAVARAIEAGGDPRQVLTEWASDARRILAACEARGDACTLICAADARAEPERAKTILATPLAIASESTSAVRPAADLLHRLLAEALVASEPEIAPLAAALEARTLRLTEPAADSADADAALAALRAIEGRVAAAREEIELLRAHLRLVQGQVELHDRRAQDGASPTVQTTAKTATLKRELAEVRAELEAHRASLSWRLTTPLRAIAALLPPGLSPTGFRLRRAIGIVRKSPLFDAAWYLAHNNDLASGDIDPAEHYVRHGWREGRRPGPNFDGASYLRANPDVAATHKNPLLHYIEHGMAEGRPLAPPAVGAGRP